MSAISTLVSNTGFKLQKHSPEILTGVGIVGIVTAGVLAARATLKLEETVEKLEWTKGNIHEKLENKQITADEAKKLIFSAHREFLFDLTKLYGPAVTLGAVGITSVISAQGIMKKRNLALLGAYKSVEQAYSEYRKRVQEAIGEERENEIRLGLRAVDQDESTDGENDDTPMALLPKADMYSVLFDQLHPNYSTGPFYNQNFIKGQENYANMRLKSKGHVFLNEVYDMLGFQMTPEGALVGWINNGDGDNVIDFGVFGTHPGAPTQDAFVKGEEHAAWLQFNVDGVIWDKI